MTSLLGNDILLCRCVLSLPFQHTHSAGLEGIVCLSKHAFSLVSLRRHIKNDALAGYYDHTRSLAEMYSHVPDSELRYIAHTIHFLPAHSCPTS
ncbi:uncharacterized protein ARMOST_02878 [Armillaria ostoyae]|uniref:Uncharacterized protein n=1 Tax=Armillaria ostoyae TaxID=47428 RepID=A0A284QSY1_ARMOS|nr:uncharacterized protein ARMOST_02878 [Armillaria ostoyae]